MRKADKEGIDKAIRDGALRWALVQTVHEAISHVEQIHDRKLDTVASLSELERRGFTADMLFQVAGRICENAGEIKE